MMLPSENDIVIGGNCPKCGGSFIDCKCDTMNKTTQVVRDAMKAVSKDVRKPKIVRDYFKSVKDGITQSTSKNDYSVYIPEDAKLSQSYNTAWTDIINDFVKSNYGVQESQLEFYEWLKTYYNPPTKKSK